AETAHREERAASTTVAPTGTTVAPTGTTVAPTGTTVAPTGTTVAPTGTTVAPTDCSSQENTMGSLIDPRKSTELECCNLCADQAFCAVWEYDEFTGACSLKDGQVSQVTLDCFDYRTLTAGRRAFQLDGTLKSYVVAPAPLFDLTALTVCIWGMASSTGTLFSYSVPDNPEELSIRHIGDLRITIKAQSRRIGLSLNDGEWHHVCLTWQSVAGFYNLFVDGTCVYNECGFNQNGNIKRDGYLVLGQHQTLFKGGFKAWQAFEGHIMDFNLWSYVLSPGEITAAYNVGCGSDFLGSDSNWLEIRDIDVFSATNVTMDFFDVADVCSYLKMTR
ncbi:C-reactive protein-like, partial [Saccoglossus kowalevskii]